MNTTYFLNLVAGNLFGDTDAQAIPTEYYIGLSSTTPALDGTNVTEPPASTGYARMKLPGFTKPTNGAVTNTGTVTFNEFLSNWNAITHYVIYDSPNRGGGHLLMFDELSEALPIEMGTIMRIVKNDVHLSVQNPS